LTGRSIAGALEVNVTVTAQPSYFDWSFTMNRILKSVFVVALAAGMALVGSAPASAFGGGGATTNGAIGCCRAFH